MRRDAKMRMLRFFGSFFGRVFSPPFEEDKTILGERDEKKKSESGRKKTCAKETRAHLLDRGLLRGGGLLFCRRGGVDL